MRWRMVLTLTLFIGTIPTAVAQPSVDARRAAKRQATALFLDSTQPQKDRLAAAERMGYPEKETHTALQRVAADQNEPDAVRLRAFRFLHYGDQYLDLALKVLDDPNDGGAELDAGLIEDIIRRITFRLPEQDQQRIIRSFRKRLDDPRDKVRLYAFRATMALHDSLAISRLTDSLRAGTGVPIPIADAIDLLDQDGAQNYISVIRPYLDNSDPHVQAKAARALAGDPDSRPRIVRLATDAQTAEEVRLNALRALAREDRAFASYAIAMVSNTRETPEVRYAAMHGFVGRMNYTEVPAEDQIRFAQAVERVALERALTTTEGGRRTATAAKELLAYLKTTFAPIQRFYANR